MLEHRENRGGGGTSVLVLYGRQTGPLRRLSPPRRGSGFLASWCESSLLLLVLVLSHRLTGQFLGKLESSDLRILVFHEDANSRKIGGVIVPVVVPHYSPGIE